MIAYISFISARYDSSIVVSPGTSRAPRHSVGESDVVIIHAAVAIPKAVHIVDRSFRHSLVWSNSRIHCGCFWIKYGKVVWLLLSGMQSVGAEPSARICPFCVLLIVVFFKVCRDIVSPVMELVFVGSS